MKYICIRSYVDYNGTYYGYGQWISEGEYNSVPSEFRQYWEAEDIIDNITSFWF